MQLYTVSDVVLAVIGGGAATAAAAVFAAVACAVSGVLDSVIIPFEFATNVVAEDADAGGSVLAATGVLAVAVASGIPAVVAVGDVLTVDAAVV